MHFTDRALDYALELADPRTIAYTLMRKAMIATETGNSAQGLGIANSALKYKDALTPRLRAVILRQRSYSNAALGEVMASARDSDEAVTERACTASEEVIALAQGLGSRRVVGQIDLLHRGLARWRQDPAVAGVRGRLKVLVDSYKPEREAA
jgi:hypothetical protein